MGMLRIWGRKTSVNVQKVMWAVAELNLAHERIDAGGAFGQLDTAEYGALNPNRLVPAMDDNGFTLWESHAIVRYLATTYGRGGFCPVDPRDIARADQWLEWSNTTIYADIIGGLFAPLVRTPAKDRNVAAVEAAAKRAGEKLSILDAHLADRSYILGDTLRCADVGAGTLMYRYFTLPAARPSLPNIEAWCGRLAERPAFQTHVMIDWEQLKVPGT
jgi:glutathione S-transferase